MKQLLNLLNFKQHLRFFKKKETVERFLRVLFASYRYSLKWTYNPFQLQALAEDEFLLETRVNLKENMIYIKHVKPWPIDRGHDGILRINLNKVLKTYRKRTQEELKTLHDTMEKRKIKI